MKVLMVMCFPPLRTLGAARIQVELAEALRGEGCEVDMLSGADVYPDPPRIARAALLRSFARASRGDLRRIARRYDVVDGLEGDVTATKRELAFEGVLVSRTAGLRDFFVKWESEARGRWAQHPRGHPLGRSVRAAHRHATVHAARVSRRNADGFFVANAAERACVAADIGEARVCQLPFGLPDDHRLALNRVARARARASAPHAVFIGTWDARKGKYDLPTILSTVALNVPEARFTFLGTYASEAEVVRDLGSALEHRVDVRPTFAPAELPDLLATATVGIFPSYLEGFGFAVIEQLAAGVPVIAYDVPGPRDILADLDDSLLVPVGDMGAFSSRVIRAMRTGHESPEPYIVRASDFRWATIAQRTIESYQAWAST